jgi:hypothetical protein
MYKLLFAVIISAALLSGCNKSGAPAGAATGASASAPAGKGDAVDQNLQKLAGSEAKQPFYVAYDMPGMSVGIAGAADGKLYSVNYSAEAYKPDENLKGQLSEENHVLTMPCPAALRVAQSGRVTCFPAASATGSNPHGGGMGGMMAAPPGTENPHGSMSTTPGASNPHAGGGAKIPPKRSGT